MEKKRKQKALFNVATLIKDSGFISEITGNQVKHILLISKTQSVIFYYSTFTLLHIWHVFQ